MVRIRLSKQPGLPTLRVQVSMAAEKGVKGSQLIPPRHQLAIRIAKETTHIRSTEREAWYPLRSFLIAISFWWGEGEDIYDYTTIVGLAHPPIFSNRRNIKAV